MQPHPCCLLLHHSGHAHKQLAVPTPPYGYISAINMILEFMQAIFHDCFCSLTYILFQLIIRGNSQYFFPTHCKLPLCTLSGKLQTFPMVVLSKTIGFLLNRTQQYTPVLLFRKIPTELLPENELLSSHYAAYTRVTDMCYPTWWTWLYLGALWKLLEPLGRTTYRCMSRIML